MLKNTLSISYNDLIERAEAQLSWMEKSYPENKNMTDRTKKYNLECQRTLVRLLKKCRREKQMDLFEAFEKMAK